MGHSSVSLNATYSLNCIRCSICAFNHFTTSIKLNSILSNSIHLSHMRASRKAFFKAVCKPGVDTTCVYTSFADRLGVLANAFADTLALRSLTFQHSLLGTAKGMGRVGCASTRLSVCRWLWFKAQFAIALNAFYSFVSIRYTFCASIQFHSVQFGSLVAHSTLLFTKA